MLPSIAKPHCYPAVLPGIYGTATRRTPTPQCHGRTDGRTDVDPHSPSVTNPLFSNARAHIRGMDVAG